MYHHESILVRLWDELSIPRMVRVMYGCLNIDLWDYWMDYDSVRLEG